MRYVVNNATAAHFWAHQSQDQANRRGATRGSLSFSGRTCYSYSTAMGTILEHEGKRVYVLNSAYYSSTTSHHQSIIRQAIPHGSLTFWLKDTPPDSLEQLFAIYRHELEREVLQLPALLVDGSVGVRRTKALGRLAEHINCHAEFLALIGKPGAFDDLMSADARAQIETRLEEERAKQAERDRLRDEEARLREEDRLLHWLAGENVYGYFAYSDCRLRIVGETVETTRGASVPLAHVARALPIVLAYVQSGRVYERNGHSIHVGSFVLDRITADGEVYVGCHRFSREEIERFALLVPAVAVSA